MAEFLADEGFNYDVVQGVRARIPRIDLIRVQDLGMEGTPDSDVLAWAAREGRIVLTSDKRTMKPDAEERLRNGLPMPGLVIVHQDVSIGNSINGLLDMIQSSQREDWENQIRFVRRR